MKKRHAYTIALLIFLLGSAPAWGKPVDRVLKHLENGDPLKAEEICEKEAEKGRVEGDEDLRTACAEAALEALLSQSPVPEHAQLKEHHNQWSGTPAAERSTSLASEALLQEVGEDAAGLEQVIAEYPGSHAATESTRRLWEQINDRRELDEVRSFLERYADSPDREEALGLKRQLAFEHAENIDTIDGWMALLKDKPTPQVRQHAIDRKNTLAWNLAENENSISAWQDFLEKYPQHPRKSEAKERLEYCSVWEPEEGDALAAARGAIPCLGTDSEACEQERFFTEISCLDSLVEDAEKQLHDEGDAGLVEQTALLKFETCTSPPFESSVFEEALEAAVGSWNKEIVATSPLDVLPTIYPRYQDPSEGTEEARKWRQMAESHMRTSVPPEFLGEAISRRLSLVEQILASETMVLYRCGVGSLCGAKVAKGADAKWRAFDFVGPDEVWRYLRDVGRDEPWLLHQWKPAGFACSGVSEQVIIGRLENIRMDEKMFCAEWDNCLEVPPCPSETPGSSAVLFPSECNEETAWVDVREGWVGKFGNLGNREITGPVCCSYSVETTEDEFVATARCDLDGDGVEEVWTATAEQKPQRWEP